MTFRIYDKLCEDAKQIRTEVFVAEQGFETEFDDTDSKARHIVGYDGEKPVAVCRYFRFLYKGIIIKHNKTEPTYTKTSLFLCEKRRFFMGRTEKGGKVF